MSNAIITSLAPILVVEDEEDHARLIIRALKDSGKVMNELVWLQNGEEALKYLNKTESGETMRPALILLDVKMPMKNGFEVLQEVKGSEAYKTIPVVMLTTTSTSEDIGTAMDLGANDYIVKPVKFADFTDKVKNLGYYWGVVSDAGRNSSV